ncbi:sensor domain-containing diguanylate cyclase [Chloroflexus sp.]|uniref:sensor domain-containing diguanylate cyclase n=1 Tax=Chloroflexus sp. TaxID=1904827 RepID=UPI002ACE0058|nr:sensor domain-containing diguanylate cyclase [Chloroflexus sp.]
MKVDLFGTSELSILVSPNGQMIAASEAMLPLLSYVEPLLPDFVQAANGADVFLNGLQYVMQRQLLWQAAGVPFGLLITFRQPMQNLLVDHRLGEMALTLSSKLEMNHVLEHVVRFAMDLLDADAGALPVYDPDHDRLLPGHLVNLPVDLVTPAKGSQRGLMWQMIEQGKSILIPDYAAHPMALPELARIGVSSLLATPIMHGKTPLGILAVYRLRNEPFQENDRDLLQAIAHQTAIALQSARMYQRAIRNADERYILYQASIEIGATLDLEQLYQAIHRAVDRLIPHAGFVIALLNDQQMVEYVYLVTPTGRQPELQLPLTHGIAGYVLRFGVSLRLSGVHALPAPAIQPALEVEGDLPQRSLLATPLVVGDRIIGALLAWHDHLDAYTMSDLSALEMLAATVAVALHQALRFTQIQALAITDTLTELVNRRHFFHILQHELDRSRRYQTPVSVAMIDIDHFKQVNDIYGHLAGDHILRELAQRCRQHLRDVDILARYGGEEFGLILPETVYETALVVADRLRQMVATTPLLVDGRQVTLTLSIGVATFQPVSHPDPSSLIADADRALYLAKRRGRNRVCGAQELSTYAEP